MIAESKALAMAGVPLPEVARLILAQVYTHTHTQAQTHAHTVCGLLQEVRVKQFRQSLQQVLDDFYSTLDSLHHPLCTLLQSHIDSITRYSVYV